jgi:hypothetical protein
MFLSILSPQPVHKVALRIDATLADGLMCTNTHYEYMDHGSGASEVCSCTRKYFINHHSPAEFPRISLHYRRSSSHTVYVYFTPFCRNCQMSEGKETKGPGIQEAVI